MAVARSILHLICRQATPWRTRARRHHGRRRRSERRKISRHL